MHSSVLRTGYLAGTKEEYAIVKLTGKSKLILEENETVL